MNLSETIIKHKEAQKICNNNNNIKHVSSFLFFRLDFRTGGKRVKKYLRGRCRLLVNVFWLLESRMFSVVAFLVSLFFWGVYFWGLKLLGDVGYVLVESRYDAVF